jgi:hypothetical protein
MRIFISHSWRDKTTADQLTRDLGSMAEVWQDIEQLKPGDRIQPTIDRALADMDLVVLLWSEHAAQSNGVAEEVQTSQRLDKTILPCVLEDTPLRDELKGVLALDFDHYAAGFGRLCIAILRHLSASLDLDVAEELRAIKDVEGAINYVQDYRNKQEIGGPDRDHWIERIVTAMHSMFDRVTQLQGRLQNAGDFIQQIYGKLEEAGEDRAKLQEILQEVIRHEHLAPDLMPQVRGHIEKYLRRLPPPQVPTRPAQAFRVRAASLASSFAQPDDQARQQLQARLRGQIAPSTLPMATDLLHDYVSSARHTLDALSNVGTAYQSSGMMQVVQFLLMYLEEPNDLMPESEHGVWGYLDDAWLIHNTAYRLVEAGLLPATAFPIQWDRIASADLIATACLPPMVRYELENYLTQLLGVIASEVMAYTPQFTHGGHTYHPQMGQAPAVGRLSEEARVLYDSMQNSLAQISLDSWSVSIDADYAASQDC